MDKVRLCDSKTPQPCWNGSPYQPIPVTDEATTQQALQIRERAEDFPGITAEPTAVRRYPAPGKANTAQVLGYLSPVTDEEITEGQGHRLAVPALRPGRPLRPRAHVRQGTARQGRRHPLRGRQPRPGHRPGRGRPGAARLQPRHQHRRPRPGASPSTSCNEAMKDARKEIDKNTGENYKADSGAVVVMEAKTGRVVAMASQPDYDPNAWVGGISAKDYAKLTGKNSNYPLLNRAIQGQAAPGSIFKVVSTTAAVNAGYAFDGDYHCPSSYSIGGQVFKNFESQGHGPITLGQRPRGLLRHRLLRPRPPGVAEGRRHQAEEERQRLVLQDRPPVRPRHRDRHRPAQRGHRPRPRPPVEAGLLGGQQGRLVQAGQEGRHLRRADRLRELPRRQPDARR